MNERKLKSKIIEHFGSQWQFARKLNAHESLVSKVIRGRRSLSLEDQNRWARALKCSRADLFIDGN